MGFKLGGLANTVLTAFVSAIAGGIITVLVTTVTNQDQNKTRFLDYSVENTSIFGSEYKVPKDKIKVVVNDDVKNPVQEVGQVTFRLYNLSDKDFDKVRLFVEMGQKDEGKSLKIISQDISSEYKDSTKSSELPPSDSKSTKKYTYDIEDLNRSRLQKEGYSPDQESSLMKSAYAVPVRPVFKVTYTIIGEKVSNIDFKLSVKKMGVEVRNISYDSVKEYEAVSQQDLWGLLVLRFPLVLLLVFFITFFYIKYLVSYFQLQKGISKREKSLGGKFREFFAQPNTLNQLRVMQDPNTLAQELTIINRKIRNQESDIEIVKTLTERLSEPGAINKFQQLTDAEVIKTLLEVDPDPMKSQLNFWEWFLNN
jgi:hypothetical protein